jgi:hypothetical protein
VSNIFEFNKKEVIHFEIADIKTGEIFSEGDASDIKMTYKTKEERVNKICSKECWNYDNCLKRNTIGMVACFKKNESLCHYCINEEKCKNSSTTTKICTMFEKR